MALLASSKVFDNIKGSLSKYFSISELSESSFISFSIRLIDFSISFVVSSISSLLKSIFNAFLLYAFFSSSNVSFCFWSMQTFLSFTTSISLFIHTNCSFVKGASSI
ncbi:hypothetical protein AUK10_03385 [Candidatus Gracilibacteria bacterium CG2_30_37_12]|nr:MAG: hypothetical protein AUK10_03385 [Candidatus Gracilibacteria bacterium CG2_30_37_12]